MKKKITILFLFLIQNILTITIYAQGGTWTWISGDTILGSPGVYGIQGVPSVNNHPPGVYEPCEWKDKQGNFWIYGGNYNNYADLWKFNPISLEWTWVKGNGLQNQIPVYGTKGVANILNTPGYRIYCATTWVDTSGVFWLFGGTGSSNALWKYELNSNMWTWVNGGTNLTSLGVYGLKGVPSALNVPGIREETCSGWTDSLNNLWLFGGWGNAGSKLGFLNDMWKYNILSNEWTWMAGDSIQNVIANYGIKGVSNSTNNPGGRFTYTKWKDKIGNFWIFGAGYPILKDDVWKFQPDINEWVWTSGTSLDNDSGNYNSTCNYTTNGLPRARNEQRSAVTDNCGRFWMYGGVKKNGNAYLSLNDLWIFDPQQLNFSLLSGSNFLNQPGKYGALGVPDFSNLPPGRGGAVSWWGHDNKFYMFGGFGSYCDMWVWDPDTNCTQICYNKIIANVDASDTLICKNKCIDFFDYSLYGPNTWQWTFFGASPSNSTLENPQNICYNTSGNFDVSLIACNGAGCDTITYSAFIHVLNNPTVNLGNDTLICIGDSVTLDAGSGYTSYLWNTNDTSKTITVSSPGTYFVNISNGECNATDTLIVTTQICVGAIPNFTSSDSLFCEKQCINFTDISQNNPTSWQWTFNGASPSTSTDQNPANICYNVYGTYDVTLVACNQFGCDTITKSNFITSYITPLDSIWFANDTLFALPAYSYQWYEVGAGLIVNATQNFYVPLTLGNYYCITKDTDGCESTSNVILFTSFFENENHEIANGVWPNPANEILFVNPQLLNAKNIILEIYDMQGRIILHQMLDNNKNTINILQLATSVYSYRVMTNEKIIAQGKFVKQIKN